MNVKKLLALALTALVSVCAVFAQGSYVVKSVKGTVKYSTTVNGVVKEDKVTVGQTLSATTKVNVGLYAVLVLELDGVEYTINGAKKDTLDKLVGVKSNELHQGGTVAGTSKADSGVGKSTSTASSRANDAQEEKNLDWDE